MPFAVAWTDDLQRAPFIAYHRDSRTSWRPEAWRIDLGVWADGELVGDCVKCPLHGSVFQLSDGSVEQGPAAYPQPVLEARVNDGSIEVRNPRG